MYLENVMLKFIQPCTTDSNRIRAIAMFSRDISDILPFVNTYIKNGIYNDKSKSFTFSYEDKLINICNNEVNIAKLVNETDAFEMLDYIKDMINNIYNKRDEIIPSREIKKLPSPLEIYQYLPKINCKDCGNATCLAFAAKLVKDEVKLKWCNKIYEIGNEENKSKLEAIVLNIGYAID